MLDIKKRYYLVPQMKFYDQITCDYEPFLMFFNKKNFRSNFVNTDTQGFRLNIYQKKKVKVMDLYNKEVSIVLGGSTVFGFGSTNDKNTISSILTDKTGKIFLNFGATAFNSKQEFILFINYFKKFKKIKNVIIISGINDLFLNINNYPKNSESFFFKENYTLAFNLYKIRNNISKKLLYFAYKNIKSKYVNPVELKLKDFFIKRKKVKKKINFNNLKNNYKSTFNLWDALSKKLEFKMYFFLQPIPTWSNKKLSSEEKVLFSILDNSDDEAHLMLNKIAQIENHSLYLKILKKCAVDNNIFFKDLNEQLKSNSQDSSWLFVDRVHMTDLGYSKVSNIILNCI
jgi:hypothetical protein